jgi:hypothetical protein
MSTEYDVHTKRISEDVLLLISESIKERFPLAKIGSDNSLWIESSDPKWIDFSIERTDEGLFVVSNLNGADEGKIFSLIELILMSHGINYSIEEI